MPDTVIDWVDLIGKYLQYILLFTDCKGWLIGDGDVEISVVHGDGNENDALIKIVNEIYFDYQEDQEEFHPDQDDQTIIQQPVKIELEPL